ncbi:ATP-binding cassette domain-containing protein [Vagococcus silagei]|uniref:UvrABC system protein A n=1 Tax=Vagococcus silagei TaxID=2508885 RepID=A0A4V3TV98_9ENTE|nr:excinuclease ABC subunit UvrA [Vagococcus silagei]THB62049.1 excinuclease ABC subunit UvrA [Vagococcus silagei]
MTAEHENIILKGMRQNNLQNVSLEIPKNKITIFTGVSGSGKSSIVFDTIANEAGRQMNQTYSTFVQGFLPKYEKPIVDSIQNLSPAFIVDQKRLGGNARSTLGTRTDIYSFLRLLFSRVATPFVGFSNVYSFNDPDGMCPHCQGIGKVIGPNVDLIIDFTKSLNDDAVLFPPFRKDTWYYHSFAEADFVDKDLPLNEYTPEDLDKLLYGHGGKIMVSHKDGTYKTDFEGILYKFNRLYIERDLSKHSESTQKKLSAFTVLETCPSCHGQRLNDKSLSSRLNGKTIADLTEMELTDLLAFIKQIDAPEVQPMVSEIVIRLQNLIDMNLDYLTLSRETTTLSGGESQRIKVVQYLNNSLNNVLYIFDEPSTGLHPRDVQSLNKMLQKLRDKGNTVLVVEHDPDVIEVADLIVDVGPLAGSHGGEIMFTGTVAELKKRDTLTGQFLNQSIDFKEAPRQPDSYYHVLNATANNLKQIDVDIPKNVLTVVTGVAGSGKSSLIFEEFVKQHPEAIVIDQSALHKSNRSNLATYTKILTTIREIYAKKHQVDKALFSFNSTGGCEKCNGKGYIVTELAFMEGVKTTCTACNGTQYKEEVLQFKLGGYNIVEILKMTVSEALDFFENKKISKVLSTLEEVGLGYLSLGQMMDTLSGGECQRIKLASELHKSGNLYILDEPTTGLHMANVKELLDLLERLVNNGSSVVVIEHNVDVMKHADWIIDIGPEAGKNGGEIMYAGPVKEMKQVEQSLTAKYL